MVGSLVAAWLRALAALAARAARAAHLGAATSPATASAGRN
nr:hypothetical protein [Candidatus Frankia alpina]